MRAESLILDIDGTLWDSRHLLALAYNDQLAEDGIPGYHITAAMLRPLFGKPVTEINDTLFPELPEQQRRHLLEGWLKHTDEYLEAYGSAEIAYPNVRTTVEALAKRHRLFIVSNGHASYPEVCARKLGFADQLSGSLTFGQTGLPKGQTIRMLMEKHGIQSAAYIGDTQGDLEASRTAGIPFVWASYGFGTPKEYDARIQDLTELITLFGEDL